MALPPHDEDEMRQLRSALSFYEASQALFSLKDPERLAEVVVELVSSVMDATVVSLMLPDTNGQLYIANARGLPRPLQTSVRLPMGERIAGHVAARHEPILLTDALSQDDRFAHLEAHGRVASSIVYPLVAGDELVGILNMGRTGSCPFGLRDLERAGVVASQVTLALNNLRLWRQIGLSERLATIGQVAASVVHEIKSPLTAVVGNTQIAKMFLDDAVTALRGHSIASTRIDDALRQLRDALDETESAASCIGAIARDVGMAVRRDEAVEGILDVNDAIHAAVRLSSSTLRRSARIEERLDPGLLVQADRGRLCQVFLNLLVNAAQSLETSRVSQPRIQVVASRDGDEVRIDVCDNGPGILPENLARVFDPFFTTKGPESGTGLGLAISAEIVNRYGGRIDVQSAEGKGARFSVHLPAVQRESVQPS